MEVELEVERNFASRAEEELGAACRACFAVPVFEASTPDSVQTRTGVRLGLADGAAALAFCRRCSDDMKAADDFRRRCARSSELLRVACDGGGIKLEDAEQDVKIEYDVPVPPMRAQTPPQIRTPDEDDDDEIKRDDEFDDASFPGSPKKFDYDSEDDLPLKRERADDEPKSKVAGRTSPARPERVVVGDGHTRPLAAYSYWSDNARPRPRRAADGSKPRRRRVVARKPRDPDAPPKPDERRFQCDPCGRTFRQSTDLTKHMRVHTGSKPYQCEACEKRFAQQSNLLRHLRTHTGERPFKCEFCAKAFAVKAKLDGHRVVHTGERPFACKLCPKTYAHRNGLATHLKSHSGERPYKCQLCDRAFARNSYLTLHVRTHTGEKPYQCEVCAVAFSNSSSLSAHAKAHAKEKS